MPYRLSAGFDLSDPALVSVIDDLALWSAPFGLRLLETVRLRRSLRVLDVGTGAGFPAVELSQRLGPSSAVFGLDPWRAALERARLKTRLWEVPNLHLVQGRAEALGFPDRAFDLIVSNNGTNNVDDEERAFAELGRVAKPGAQMALTMNLPETMSEFYATFASVMAARGMAAEVERMKAHIFEKRKPLDHTSRLLERSGFAIESVHQDAFTMRYLDGTTMLAHFLVRLAFLQSWMEVPQPADAAVLLAEVEAELNRRAEREGRLTLTVPWVCIDCRRRA